MSVLHENEPALWRAHLPAPDAASHKYSRGTALVRGGAMMTGAARLAARAAQRIGAGLVTLAAPDAALPVYAAALESVIVRPCDDEAAWQSLIDAPHHPAMLLGPGLGLGEEQKKEVLMALGANRPTVLDADALTAFADHPKMLFNNLHADCVLTPHEGEFARLFPDLTGDKTARAQAAAKRADCVIVLKGSETIIAAPDDNMAANHNAPPWLATAGSGDVLAGLILGLLAQKMPAFLAASAAVWIHGQSAANHGPGLIAEDIVDGIPAVLAQLAAR